MLWEANNPRLKAFVDGVTAAATGAIAGAAFVLVVLLKIKRIPEPLVILLAGGVRLELRR